MFTASLCRQHAPLFVLGVQLPLATMAKVSFGGYGCTWAQHRTCKQPSFVLAAVGTRQQDTVQAACREKAYASPDALLTLFMPTVLLSVHTQVAVA